jgi:hypothetical protein
MKKLYIVLLGVALFALVIGSVYSGSQSSVSPSPTTEVVTQEKDLTNLASDTLLQLNITNDCPKHASVSHLHWMDCATRVNAIRDTASQIDLVESSGFAQHNMDAAVQLDYDRKNLAAELNSFHDEFDGK